MVLESRWVRHLCAAVFRKIGVEVVVEILVSTVDRTWCWRSCGMQLVSGQLPRGQFVNLGRRECGLELL